MSRGTQSPTFAPVQGAMLDQIAMWYPRVGEQRIRRIFEIMTDRFTTETLLFVTVIDLIERKLTGNHSFETPVDHLGPRLRLSVISADGTYKLQTPQMRDLHDVLVELQMSNRIFWQLQRYVKREFGLTFVFDHSCGSGLVPVKQAKSYLKLIMPEEEFRTKLDWIGGAVRQAASAQELLRHRYSPWEADALEQIWVRSYSLVQRFFEPAHELAERFGIATVSALREVS